MIPNLLIASFAGLIGAITGSSFNALIYRLPRKISWATKHSHCPSCKTNLSAPDLIPILSWLALGGKCRHCHTKIGTKYLLIELFLATSNFTIFLLLPPPIALICSLIINILLFFLALALEYRLTRL